MANPLNSSRKRSEIPTSPISNSDTSNSDANTDDGDQEQLPDTGYKVCPYCGISY